MSLTRLAACALLAAAAFAQEPYLGPAPVAPEITPAAARSSQSPPPAGPPRSARRRSVERKRNLIEPKLEISVGDDLKAHMKVTRAVAKGKPED